MYGGKELSHDQLNRKYHFQCNIIRYRIIKLLLKTFVAAYNNDNTFPYRKPNLVDSLTELVQITKGESPFVILICMVNLKNLLVNQYGLKH